MDVSVVGQGSPVVAPASSPPRRRWWIPVAVFGAVAVALWLVAGWSASALPRTEAYSPAPEHFVGGWFFEPWARWDASWYRSIVTDGYVYYPGVQSSVAFWPAYPLALAVLEPLFPSPYVTGTVLTVLSGLAAVILFSRWASGWLGRSAALTATLVLALFPFAWYLYGPVYADAFCLAMVVGAFLAIERDRLWLAVAFGFVASASRPIGLVFAVALVLRYVELRNTRAQVTPPSPHPGSRRGALAGPDGSRLPEPPYGVRLAHAAHERWTSLRDGLRWRFSPRRLRWSDAGVLLVFGGFAAWCAYLWWRFDDPFLWQRIQSAPGWDQGSGPSTWFKTYLVDQVLYDASSPFTWSKVVQGAVAVAMLLLVPHIGRRFGWAYALYTAGVVLVPILGTKDFQGTGRYLLAAFPVFAVVGEWLADRPRARVLFLTASGLLLVAGTSLFARGHYLA